MKYAFLLTLFLVIILSASCNKNNDPLDEFYWGEVTALKNGLPWEARPYCSINKPYLQGVDLSFDRYNERDYLRDAVHIFKIQDQIGIYLLTKSDVREIDSLHGARYHTSLSDGAGGDFYNLLEGVIENKVTIDRKEGEQIWGTFQVAFVKKNLLSTEDPTAPDTVIYTGGKFHTKVFSEE